MRNCLIGKKKKFVQLGLSEQETKHRVDDLIEGIQKQTNLTLNADESVKSLSMEPEQRAFYEGAHLEQPTEEEQK